MIGEAGPSGEVVAHSRTCSSRRGPATTRPSLSCGGGSRHPPARLRTRHPNIRRPEREVAATTPRRAPRGLIDPGIDGARRRSAGAASDPAGVSSSTPTSTTADPPSTISADEQPPVPHNPPLGTPSGRPHPPQTVRRRRCRRVGPPARPAVHRQRRRRVWRPAGLVEEVVGYSPGRASLGSSDPLLRVAAH
jgi:hypothetical protein